MEFSSALTIVKYSWIFKIYFEENVGRWRWSKETVYWGAEKSDGEKKYNPFLDDDIQDLR